MLTDSSPIVPVVVFEANGRFISTRVKELVNLVLTLNRKILTAQKVRIGIVSLCNCGVEKAEFSGDLRIRAPSDSDTRN